MIYGIGVDLTPIARIEAAQAKNPNFAKKVLAPEELQIFAGLDGARASEWLAGRFAVKEAYAKAYGTGLGEVALQDVACLDLPNGKPVLTRHPYAGKAFVSIAHTGDLAMAEVILEVGE